MIIYNKKKYPVDHRKIYENYHGPIPIDEFGRTFEIHHIDGNSENNQPNNLIALSINDHYNLHLSQGDYMACFLIGIRMRLDNKDISILSSKHQKALVEAGIHPWLKENGGGHKFDPNDISIREKQRYDFGDHVFKTTEFQEKRLQGYAKSIKNRKENGTFHMSVKNPGKPFSQGHSINQDRILKGNHPSQIKKQCIHCNKTLDTANYAKYHGDKCKSKDMI